MSKSTQIRKIAVMTSGGDSPGMNACIRAVVRSAIYQGLEVVGIRRGYTGMIAGDFVEMQNHSVSNIIQRGGTILKSARSEEFRTKEGRAKAAKNLLKANIDGLICIGGDGSFHGGYFLQQEHHIPVIGIPGTIDNDLYGTDYTLGYDTAINTALEAIDKIRDTAAAHDRLFFVEVMGRDSGFIAIECAIGGGAEAALIPETKTDFEKVKEILQTGLRNNKLSSLVIVAEGEEEGGAFDVAKQLKDITGYETRVTVLGHIQRGGSPTARDRVLASRLGFAAVEAMAKGTSGVMVGIVNNQVKLTALPETWEKKKIIDEDLIQLIHVLSV